MPLLLFRAGGEDRRRAAAAQAQGDIDPGEFLFDDVLRHTVAALAAVLLSDS